MKWAQFVYLAAIDFGIMWLMWGVPAWYETEKLFDVTGNEIAAFLTL